VARFDLKADRRAATLVVAASHLEPEASLPRVVESAASELATLAAWLGLERVAVAATTDLGRGLRSLLRRRPIGRAAAGAG